MRLLKAWWTLVCVALWAAPAFAQDAGGAAAKPAAAEKKTADKKAAPADKKKAGDAKAGSEPAAEEKKEPAATPGPTAQPPGPTGAPPTASGTSSGAAASKPATTATGDQPLDGATYAVRLRDLEQRIDELKEQIRRSHTRLSLLSDTILSGGVGGARAEIRFTNDMSTAFKLIRALFVLDGAVQYNKQDDTGALAEQKQIPIFSGSIPPGDHTLQVLLQLRGHGYGVFSYLRGYRFELKSSHSFTVTEGKTVELEAVAWEKGGVTTPLEQRPAVRYVEKVKGGLSEGTASPTPTSSGGKSGASGSFQFGTGGK